MSTDAPIDPRPGDDRDELDDHARRSRRHLLRLAGAAAAGGLAAAVVHDDAGAANGDPLVVGSTSNSATNATGMAVIGSSVAYGFGLTDNGLATVPPALLGSAVLGHAKRQAFTTGVAGLAVGGGTVGVVGRGGAVGVQAVATNGVGLVAMGGRAAMRLDAAPAAVPPPQRTTASDTNMIDATLTPVGTDSQLGTLWHCVQGGTPGTWRRLSGADTAGALTPIDPVRVYDSRLPTPSQGTLGAGASRVVSVADARNAGTGAVTGANAIPVGATAIAFNITITETIGSGFLAVAPGNATSSPSSSINWFASGQTVANGLIAKLHTDRTVKVFSGGPGSTHFVIDVNGYWL